VVGKNIEGKNKLDFIYNMPKALNPVKTTIIKWAMYKIIL